MRIGFVTQWFPPEPTIVPAEIADGLAALGHQVDVLTGFPNYPDGVLQDGWKLSLHHQSARGKNITVHRAPLYPNHGARAVRRFANYMSFALGAAPIAFDRMSRPDVWLTYSSPATAHIPTMVGQQRGRAPACMIIQDLWPDSVTQSGMASRRMSAAIQPPLAKYCAFTYRHSAAIGVISPGMRKILVERGVPDGKIFDTPNWVRDDHLTFDRERGIRQRLRLPNGPLFLYAGNLGPMQNLEPLIHEFKTQDRAHLVLLGDGIDKQKLLEVGGNSPRVHFRAPVSFTDVGQYLSAADVLVVSVLDTPLLHATMPSKLQSSLAAGRPILVHGAGDVANVVTDANAGVAARPGDRSSLHKAVSRLVTASSATLVEMGLNARAQYISHFSPDVGARRVEAMLLAAVQRKNGPASDVPSGHGAKNQEASGKSHENSPNG